MPRTAGQTTAAADADVSEAAQGERHGQKWGIWSLICDQDEDSLQASEH